MPDGSALASASADGTARVWNARTGKLQKKVENPLSMDYVPSPTTASAANEISEPRIRIRPAMTAVAYSPNSKFLATASDYGVITLRHTSTWAVQRVLGGQREEVNALAFSPDASLLASGSGTETGSLKVWKVPNGTALWSSPPGETAVSSIAFSPNGKTIASGGRMSGTRLWDTQTGRLQQQLNDLETTSVAFSPDGSWLATGSSAPDDVVELHSLKGNKARRVLHYKRLSARAVAFSPDSKLLGLAYSGQRLVLWGVTSGRVLQLVPAPSSTHAIAFSPNFLQDRTMATGHYDGAVRLWRIKQ
jgi:WD40 repeat protein